MKRKKKDTIRNAINKAIITGTLIIFCTIPYVHVQATESITDQATSAVSDIKGVSTEAELISYITSTNSGIQIQLMNDIKVESDLTFWAANMYLDGNGYTIDFDNVAKAVTRGADMTIANVTFTNANGIGIQAYNNTGLILDNVTIQDGSNYAIYANGSTMTLKDVTTSNNKAGGVRIGKGAQTQLDSKVTLAGELNSKEYIMPVSIVNVTYSEEESGANQFVYDGFSYRESTTLSSDGSTSETVFYQEKELLNVVTQDVVFDGNKDLITLSIDGTQDNSENIKELIKYAAANNSSLYFPAGIYRIDQDIEFSNLGLIGIANMSILGDENGATIFTGAGVEGRTVIIGDETYSSIVKELEISHIIFENIALSFNGPYKENVVIHNNAFVNGKYTETIENNILTNVEMTPYVEVKNSQYQVYENVFLRGNNYPGRGISTYATSNTKLYGNFFGEIDDLKHTGEMLTTSMKEKILRIEELGLLDGTSQGNFFTGINVERYDTNTLVYKNYFKMNTSRNIIGPFADDVDVTGLNVASEGQRRDHIIYAKGYDNLSIYSNYFEGMENSSAGGVKIRNGENIYVGNNYFKEVPLLTYIYGDLTKEETLLYDTVIHSNVFEMDVDKSTTTILFYQSFFDGDDLAFTNGATWPNAYGDVQRFVVYNNIFSGPEEMEIAISWRPIYALTQGEFYSFNNAYDSSGELVNYNTGNAIVQDKGEKEVVAAISPQNGYYLFSEMSLPQVGSTEEEDDTKVEENDKGDDDTKVEENSKDEDDTKIEDSQGVEDGKDTQGGFVDLEMEGYNQLDSSDIEVAANTSDVVEVMKYVIALMGSLIIIKKSSLKRRGK